MSVKIRLSRHGSKKQPYYRIVVASSGSPRDGRFIEIVGHYNPNTDPASIDFKAERLRHWLNEGAVPTEIVKKLIKRAGALKEAAA